MESGGARLNDLYGVGDDGTIYRRTGSFWMRMRSTVSSRLYDVWGTSATDAFAVGDYGTILRYGPK